MKSSLEHTPTQNNSGSILEDSGFDGSAGMALSPPPFQLTGVTGNTNDSDPLQLFCCSGRSQLEGEAADEIGIGADELRALRERNNADHSDLNIELPDYWKWCNRIENENLESALVPNNLHNVWGFTNQQKVNKLFTRLNQMPFNYTGARVNWVGALLNREGDCGTLVKMFVEIVKLNGIDDVAIDSDDTPRLVQSAAIHGRDTTGNVSGADFWVFTEHYWATYAGQVYDLLFMSKNPPAHTSKTGDGICRGVSYMIFGNQSFIQNRELGKHGLDQEAGKLGRVIPTNQIRAWIEERIDDPDHDFGGEDVAEHEVNLLPRAEEVDDQEGEKIDEKTPLLI